MILELVGALVLVAVLVVLVRIESDLHRGAETLAALAGIMETDREGRKFSASTPLPREIMGSSAPIPASPRTGAEVAAAIAAARIAHMHLAESSGRPVILSGGAGEARAFPPAPAEPALPAIHAVPASPAAAISSASAHARTQAVYDGMGAGFIDVVGSEPDTGITARSPAKGESR